VKLIPGRRVMTLSARGATFIPSYLEQTLCRRRLIPDSCAAGSRQPGTAGSRDSRGGLAQYKVCDLARVGWSLIESKVKGHDQR
jgi:hypothetical protein